MTAPNESSPEAARQADRPSGLALLFLFSLATLLVVLAVWALGVVGGWWMLGLAMGVHLVMTATVLIGLVRALSDPPGPNQQAASRRTRAARVRGRAAMTS
jgi:hypothetical protein